MLAPAGYECFRGRNTENFINSIMNRRLLLPFLFLLCVSCLSQPGRNQAAAPETATSNPIENMSDHKQYAVIVTEKGTMKAELYTHETPGTVANFVELASHNFYDGLTFHRVIPGFVIQGGCPRGDGTGGPGYTIKCETSAPRQYHDRGVLSMAHAGKDTGGSQFFICHNRENTQHLDGLHTCFGKVVEGLDVIDDIRQGDKILSIRIVEE